MVEKELMNWVSEQVFSLVEEDETGFMANSKVFTTFLFNLKRGLVGYYFSYKHNFYSSAHCVVIGVIESIMIDCRPRKESTWV